MENKNSKEDKELMLKLQMFEKQIQNIIQQIDAVEKTILEMEFLKENLNELKNKKNQEIFASIGKGIFIKSKIISEELLVDVGGKNFVKKTIPETQKIIEKQIKNLNLVKKELEKEMKKIDEDLTKSMSKSV